MNGAQNALRRRLLDVEQEMDDLRSLLTIMRHIERDERLRERLRSAQLDFRLQDVWAGRLQGDALRRALRSVEALAA
jgi:hypothetical protein